MRKKIYKKQKKYITMTNVKGTHQRNNYKSMKITYQPLVFNYLKVFNN